MNKKYTHSYEYDFLVYIGKFSPMHHAHLSIIKECLTKANKLIICIGSANSPRTIKNPWTAEERMNMIISALSPKENTRIHFQFIADRLYQNQEWATSVRAGVRAILMDYFPGKPTEAKIGLATPVKDSTGWYMELFPEWKKIPMNIVNYGNDVPLSATKIRELIFTGHTNFISSSVPEKITEYITDFTKTDIFKELKQEYNDGIAYEKLYENHPKGHTINFFTADAVVIQSGHVLLIKRKNNPGKGLFALPGGHIQSDETAQEASLRELKEETNIDLQLDVLNRCLISEKIFDHPERSMRARITKTNARTVTMAFCYRLNDAKPLARVKGGDDAEEARWIPIETIQNTMSDQLFEDHKHIIDYFVSRL